ncbi:MAG: DUF445 domain-containing protein [Sciscionella sp.]
MPIIAAVIGYVTKRVAIEMMYEPLEFKGIKGTVGWQGVLPRNARRMATTAMDLLMNNLVNPKEMFARLDPNRVVEELEGPLLLAVDDVVREVLEQYQPNLWELIPEGAQNLLISRVRKEAPTLVRDLMTDVRNDIESVIDVREMAITACVRDKALLNRLIREVATPEMAFIARSGIYFGFIIGLIQMLTWALTKETIIMPIFGLCVGWLTDWFALKMIFLPREPVSIFGLFSIQGKFQRRKNEVAHDYANLIAKDVLTVHNVLEAALTGPKSDRLFAMIQRAVEHTIDAQTSFAKPFVVLATGSRRYREMKAAAARKAMAHVPDTLRYIEGYATDTLDVQNTIVAGMRELTPVEYEGLLRPAFKQDEWKLIAVGAIIGFLVGELQVLLVLHA